MDLSLKEILTQALGFLVLFVLFKMFFWKPFLNVLESRKSRIEKEFRDIEKTKQDVAALQKDYLAHMQKIEEEARAKMQEAIQEGRQIARELQEKARRDSQVSFEKAKENLELETQKARVILRNEIANLSIQVAEKILTEKMDPAKHEKKAIEILTELEKKL